MEHLGTVVIRLKFWVFLSGKAEAAGTMGLAGSMGGDYTLRCSLAFGMPCDGVGVQFQKLRAGVS